MATINGNEYNKLTASSKSDNNELVYYTSRGVPVYTGEFHGVLIGNATTAKQLELAENYRGAVYTAFQDVEDALAAVQSAQSRELFLKTVMDQSRRAYALSKESYDAGAIDFQTLLDTQISLLSAEDTYAQARLAKITAAVGLYKTMGGGWEN